MILVGGGEQSTGAGYDPSDGLCGGLCHHLNAAPHLPAKPHSPLDLAISQVLGI